MSTVLLGAAVVAALAAAPAPTDPPLDVVPADGSVQLSWRDTGAETYQVLRDGVVVATTTARTHVDVVHDTAEHTYSVLADGTPLGAALTTVAGDTTVAGSDGVHVRVLRHFEGGARLLVTLPHDGNDVAAVQVHAGGELLGRHVATGGTVQADVWGITPALLDTLEIVLEDLVGNTRVVAGQTNGQGPLIRLDLLRELPLPPVAVRVTACRNGTTITWDTLGANSGQWAVSYGDDGSWFVVDEPTVTVPSDVLHFRLATRNGGRTSDWTPPILNRTTNATLRGVPTCAVQVSEPGHVEQVHVQTASTARTTWTSVGVAGSVATLFIDGDGVAGARISGGSIATPFHVGATGDGRRIHVPLRTAQVGTGGTVRADLVGPDGSTLRSVDLTVPTPTLVTPATGGHADVALDGDVARITSMPADHDRVVLRDGVQVGHLPAGATSVDVPGHAAGHVHAYQLRGVGPLPLTSTPVVVTR